MAALRLKCSIPIWNLSKGGTKTNHGLGTLLILKEIELKIIANCNVHIVNLGRESRGLRLRRRIFGEGCGSENAELRHVSLRDPLVEGLAEGFAFFFKDRLCG